MSGKRRDLSDWAALFGGDGLEAITELLEIDPERVDGVGEPANGSGWLLMKAAAPGRGGDRAAAEGALGRLGYAPFGLGTGSHRVTGWDGSVSGRVLKSDGERRYSLALAYPSAKPDVTRAQDGWQDAAGPDAVEGAAWSYLLRHRKVGLFHEGGDGEGEVVESYIYRNPAPWTVVTPGGETQVIKQGDWLLGVCWSPPAWELLKRGTVKGLSMMGQARRSALSPELKAAVRERMAAENAA